MEERGEQGWMRGVPEAAPSVCGAGTGLRGERGLRDGSQVSGLSDQKNGLDRICDEGEQGLN